MENFNIEVLLSEIHFYKLTCRDIEKIYNIDQRFMSKYNKENNCGIKKSWKQQKEKYKEKGLYAEDLYDLYIVQNKSMREIGKIYNISDTAIKSALLFFDICTKDEIRPFNCIEYYDTRRTRNGNSRIYQAIMENQRLIILDEPTNGLDKKSKLIFYDLMKELKEHKKIILIASHIDSDINEIADRVIKIDKGKIVEDNNV